MNWRFHIYSTPQAKYLPCVVNTNSLLAFQALCQGTQSPINNKTRWNRPMDTQHQDSRHIKTLTPRVRRRYPLRKTSTNPFCCVLVQACATALHLEWCSMFLLPSMPTSCEQFSSDWAKQYLDHVWHCNLTWPYCLPLLGRPLGLPETKQRVKSEQQTTATYWGKWSGLASVLSIVKATKMNLSRVKCWLGKVWEVASWELQLSNY